MQMVPKADTLLLEIRMRNEALLGYWGFVLDTIYCTLRLQAAIKQKAAPTV